MPSKTELLLKLELLYLQQELRVVSSDELQEEHRDLRDLVLSIVTEWKLAVVIAWTREICRRMKRPDFCRASRLLRVYS